MKIKIVTERHAAIVGRMFGIQLAPGDVVIVRWVEPTPPHVRYDSTKG